MTAEWEHVCTGCGGRYATEALTEMDECTYQCDDCLERLLLDHLVAERRPVADDRATRPLGDPGEAGHAAGRPAGPRPRPPEPGRGTAA